LTLHLDVCSTGPRFDMLELVLCRCIVDAPSLGRDE
jgi:hypothetical protein